MCGDTAAPPGWNQAHVTEVRVGAEWKSKAATN